jgi:hypothetical protein
MLLDQKKQIDALKNLRTRRRRRVCERHTYASVCRPSCDSFPLPVPQNVPTA